MANTYVPARYDEQVRRLALGVEPRDAAGGGRWAGAVDVRVERFPEPVGAWRTWRPGETLTERLPRMPRHPSGRFALRYDEGVATSTVLRVVDDGSSARVVGGGRRFTPRRVRVVIATEAAVRAADAATPPHPVWRRAFPLWLWPGAAATLPSRSTVLRGQVVRPGPGATTLPVRWPRVRATSLRGDVVGWAHGDDRGEFVLVLERSPADLGVPADPVRVHLRVGVVLPPQEPDPADPVRAQVDPLWDLPVEDVVLAADPAASPTLTGRGFLPGHTQHTPTSPIQPVALPLGRETSMVVRITA